MDEIIQIHDQEIATCEYKGVVDFVKDKQKLFNLSCKENVSWVPVGDGVGPFNPLFDGFCERWKV